MAQGLERIHPAGQTVDVLSGYVPMGSRHAAAEYDRVSRVLSSVEGASVSDDYGGVDMHDPKLDHVEGQSREYFRGLAPWQRAELNERMSAVAPNSLRPQDPSQGWADHLADAPRQQVMNLWEWNRHRSVKINSDPKLHEWAETHADRYHEAVTAAVETEQLPPQANWALEKAVTAPVVLGDVFDVEMEGRGAYCVSGGERIVLGEGSRYHELTHERGHVLGRFPYQPLNEAVVEHVTLGLENGDFATVNPNKRANQGVYVSKRHLMNTIMECGLVEISAQDFIGPYIEQDGGGLAATRLWQKMADAYPSVHVLNYILSKKDMHRQQVQDRFPQSSEISKEESTDWYAALAVSGLGHLTKHRTVKEFQKVVDDMVDTTAEFAVVYRRAQPALSATTVLNAEMQSYSTRRFAEDFRQGTSFLE